MTIPPILHQTWKTSQLPEPLRTFSARWRALHPHYEYRLWTDADNAAFVREHYPELDALYRSFDREIFRADMARCLYLHHYGGVYVDLDIEPLRTLDPLLVGQSCLLGTEPQLHARKLWDKPRLVSNAVMASTPRHPFWTQMLDEIARRARRLPAQNPVSTTGPVTLDAVFASHGARLGVKLAPPQAFFPVPDLDNTKLQLSAAQRRHYRWMVELGLYPTASWGVHHWAHTWIDTQDAKRAYLRGLDRLTELAAALRGDKTIDEVIRRSRYGLLFPERSFPPRRARARRYASAVAHGYERARELSIHVLTLLHDRIDLALLQRARLSALLAPFARGKLWMISDDSRDGTAQVMSDWQRAQPQRVVQVPAPSLDGCATVYARMARLRNTLLQSSQAEPADLVCVLDGDLAGPISLDGVMHALSVLYDAKGPDAVAAFGINNWGGVPAMLPFLGYSYYDPIAFRERGFTRALSDAQVRLRLGGLRRGDAPVPVESAFAGMVIYKREALLGLRYDEATRDCEHVSLHRGLAARGARLVVDPALLLLSGRQGHHRAQARTPSSSGARQDAPRGVLGHRQDGLDRVHAHAARKHASVAHK